PISTPSGSPASCACTGWRRRAASPICARSSPASSCGTTTIWNRQRRSWCCEETTMPLTDDIAPAPRSFDDPRGRRNRSVLGQNYLFTPSVIDDIHIKAELGRYRMRGMALFKKIPSWDDLTFLPGTLTRFVIEGYREKCETRTVLGPR